MFAALTERRLLLNIYEIIQFSINVQLTIAFSLF